MPSPKSSSAERAAAAAAIAVVLAVGVAGCGGGDASGATVSVYVSSMICGPAKEGLAAHGPTAGRYRVRVVCLAPTHRKPPGGWDLAMSGADARRATEDTGSVAYLEPLTRVSRYTRPILESASIPRVLTGSGREGMAKVLAAVESAGGSSVRESVRKALEPN